MDAFPPNYVDVDGAQDGACCDLYQTKAGRTSVIGLQYSLVLT